MAKAACLNFALCLLAVAWLTVPQSAFAEEAHAKSDHQAVPEGKGEAAKGDHGSKGDHGKGGGRPGATPILPNPRPENPIASTRILTRAPTPTRRICRCAATMIADRGRS